MVMMMFMTQMPPPLASGLTGGFASLSPVPPLPPSPPCCPPPLLFLAYPAHMGRDVTSGSPFSKAVPYGGSSPRAAQMTSRPGQDGGRDPV
jgi:hypothetical protein